MSLDPEGRGEDGGMPLNVPDGEPVATTWRTVVLSELVDLLFSGAPRGGDRPWVVAVDGRSGSGKSTLVEKLLRHVEASAVVRTDDIAWHESFFEWGPVLARQVLQPLRHGESVRFSPPAWAPNGRSGAIELPSGLDLVLVEGVGSSQREFADLIDVTVWVQSDFLTAEARGIMRDAATGVNGDPQESVAFWHEWMKEELRFFDEERPWERAGVFVNGTPSGPLSDDQIEIARPPLK